MNAQTIDRDGHLGRNNSFALRLDESEAIANRDAVSLLGRIGLSPQLSGWGRSVTGVPWRAHRDRRAAGIPAHAQGRRHCSTTSAWLLEHTPLHRYSVVLLDSRFADELDNNKRQQADAKDGMGNSNDPHSRPESRCLENGAGLERCSIAGCLFVSLGLHLQSSHRGASSRLDFWLFLTMTLTLLADSAMMPHISDPDRALPRLNFIIAADQRRTASSPCEPRPLRA